MIFFINCYFLIFKVLGTCQTKIHIGINVKIKKKYLKENFHTTLEVFV